MLNRPTYTILILGGYGTFGRRISKCLAQEPGISLIIAGRDHDKAQALCHQLRTDHPTLEASALALDISHPNLQQQFANCPAELVIHTCGPFQGQNYRVAEACIATGKHYIDLADDREFVCNFKQLDTAAKAAGVLLVSGASSVPGLSSAVIDHFKDNFTYLEQVEYAIAPGNKLDRGFATIKAILSYTGHVFTHWQNGGWRKIYGWMDSTKQDFGHPIGVRHLANINIPDLELFPERYSSLQSVRFRAGLELPIMHQCMVIMAWIAKKKVINNWAPLTQLCLSVSRWFLPFGTDIGGMRMELTGQDKHNNPLQIEWTLVAEDGVGPFIPTIASILIARGLANQQIANQRITTTGALPCMGFFSLEAFMAYASQWGIYSRTLKNSEGVKEKAGENHDG